METNPASDKMGPAAPTPTAQKPQRVSPVLLAAAACAVGLDFHGMMKMGPDGMLSLNIDEVDEHGLPKIVLDESRCPPPPPEEGPGMQS